MTSWRGGIHKRRGEKKRRIGATRARLYQEGTGGKEIGMENVKPTSEEAHGISRKRTKGKGKGEM